MIEYQSNWLNTAEADAWLAWALELSWTQESLFLYGRQRQVPRWVTWYGDPGVCYRYSGLDHQATHWPQRSQSLLRAVEDHFGVEGINFVLGNRYDAGSHYMGWHQDAEAAMAADVIVLSLGETRRLRYRAERRGPSLALELEHGSLLRIDRNAWHALPRCQSAGQRVSLTFRRIESRAA